MASYIFPEDLGTEQTGHCVGFTSYQSSSAFRIAQYAVAPFNFLPGVGTPSPSVAQSLTTSKNSVFLYIPAGGQNTLSWEQEHQYTDVKMSRIIPNALGITDILETGATMFGTPINPRIEILYQTTKLRNFQFNFLMAPQSENESNQMKGIIQAFRQDAAPTLKSGGGFFDSPSEWMIHFWYKDRSGGWTENTKIPKISRSVLTRVDVSYPLPDSEYSTFSNGHPVSAMIKLLFVEMAIIDSKKISEGY